MSFGICWELSDMAALAASLNGSSLSGQLRNDARHYLQNGLSQWDQSPAGQFPWDTGICPNCHIVTYTGSRTLTQFIGTVRAVADHFVSIGQSTDATQYLRALADDIEGDTQNPTGHNSSGAEPWPQ